jgi:hypothetical protein
MYEATPSLMANPVLTTNIVNHLNNGDAVAAEVPSRDPGTRCFVCIRPVENPAVPREEFRYLNSKYSMWEYWSYQFRRIVLRDGWETDEWNYDLYLVDDERILTLTETEFLDALMHWVPDPERLRHHSESECP